MQVKKARVGWLIDGTGGPLFRDALLEIEGGRIRSLSRKKPGKGPPGEVLDFSNCTVLPGLIDCHVHLWMSGSTDRTLRERQLSAGFEEASGAVARHLEQLFFHGVVAVRDAGDRFGFVRRFKERRDGPFPFPVRLQVSGKAWHAEGRYGSLIGKPPEKGETLAQAVKREAKGLDWVKIVNSGINSLMQYGRQTAPQFSAEALKEAAAAAAAHGIPVMVHANGILPVQEALTAGVRSVEHGYFMGRENLGACATPVPRGFPRPLP